MSVETESKTPVVDPVEWERALTVANHMLGLSGEQNWASWKNGVGPHDYALETLPATHASPLAQAQKVGGSVLTGALHAS